ncbi:hypothetical protein D3C78_470450 [compost metagenome]
MELRVEVEGVSRQGMTKSPTNPKPYFILACYVSLPGIKFPQAVQLFSDKVLNPGIYLVPLVASVKDQRPAFDLDLSAAQPVKAGVSAPGATAAA